jgi:hypothetical protein
MRIQISLLVKLTKVNERVYSFILLYENNLIKKI